MKAPRKSFAGSGEFVGIWTSNCGAWLHAARTASNLAGNWRGLGRKNAGGVRANAVQAQLALNRSARMNLSTLGDGLEARPVEHDDGAAVAAHETFLLKAAESARHALARAAQFIGDLLVRRRQNAVLGPLDEMPGETLRQRVEQRVLDRRAKVD